MSQTYSTRQQDRGSGRVYSAPQSRVTMLSVRPGGPAGGAGAVLQPAAPSPAVPAPEQGPAAQAAVPVQVPVQMMAPMPMQVPMAMPMPMPAAVQVPGQMPFQSATADLEAAPPAVQPPLFARFTLTGQGLPNAAQWAPGSYGVVAVTGQPGAPLTVSAAVAGLRPPSDPAVRPVLWLIHDLTVPADLSPADLVLLPKGGNGAGNRPGGLFTLDGNPPTYLTAPNTLSVAISPGQFSPAEGGAWTLTGVLADATNQAFHPLVTLGPSALPDMNAPLPSGTVAQIFTDLFMRPGSVHPELNLQTQFQQRLGAIAGDVLSRGTPAYLDPACFTRAAVTLEGPVRTTPHLWPTRETCFLVALNRDAT